MIQIAVCDDEKNIVPKVEKQILEYAYEKQLQINIKYFDKPSKLCEYMLENTINIVFMDLEFGSVKEDGILWSTKIHKQFPQTLVLILTAYEQRYKEGYIAQAFRFMTKNFEYSELVENMDSCIRELDLYRVLRFEHQGAIKRIPINEILYFEAQFGGSKLRTLNADYYCDDNLKQWEYKVSSDIFFRCHRKYLVNLNVILKIKNHTVLLVNGEQIPVSRRKWTNLKCEYIKFDIAMKGKL